MTPRNGRPGPGGRLRTPAQDAAGAGLLVVFAVFEGVEDDEDADSVDEPDAAAELDEELALPELTVLVEEDRLSVR
ncbi:hypothetical protein [Streptosporangium roseum]|uniref:hypothetical protein n=1 Tax=Streptosporangium roseum TaxID=2001 RepID=UPI00331C5DBF